MVDKIRKKRKQLGMTQSELAERCGVSLNTIGNLERGLFMRSSTLAKVCNVLGLLVKIEDTSPIVEEKEKPTKTNNTRVQIID